MSDPSSERPIPRQLGGPGFALVERARDSIQTYRMLSGGETVVVGLSGGPDSTCLLDVLARLSGSLDLTLAVAHVDHGLSEGSGEVAARTSRAATQSGFDVHLMRIQDLEGPNLHARARVLRYGFFETVAEQVDATRIATGHTLDDRAETTLARLVHGAGTSGLAGLLPAEGKRIRPLIDCRREETRSYCDEVGLDFHDDPGNENERFDRTLIRNRLLSVVEEHWGDGAVRAIASSSARLAEDASALAELSSRIYSDLARTDGEDVRFALEGLRILPRALSRRLLEQGVGRQRDRSGGIEAALDALDGAVRTGARFAVAAGAEIELEKDDLVVRRPSREESS